MLHARCIVWWSDQLCPPPCELNVLIGNRKSGWHARMFHQHKGSSLVRGKKRKVRKLESGKGVREEMAKEKESCDTEWFHNRKQLSVVVHALCIMHGCNNCCGCIWFCITAGKVRGWKEKRGEGIRGICQVGFIK